MKPLRIHYKGKPVIYAHYHGRRLMLDEIYPFVNSGLLLGDATLPVYGTAWLAGVDSAGEYGNAADTFISDAAVFPDTKSGLSFGSAAEGEASSDIIPTVNSDLGLENIAPTINGASKLPTPNGALGLEHEAPTIHGTAHLPEINGSLITGHEAPAINGASKLEAANSGAATGHGAETLTVDCVFHEADDGMGAGENVETFKTTVPVWGEGNDGAGFGEDAEGVIFDSAYAGANSGEAFGNEAEAGLKQSIQSTAYITFTSPNAFSVGWIGTKKWDGALFWSADASTWIEWNGASIPVSAGGALYMCGSGNTKLHDSTYGGQFNVSGRNVSCFGDIMALLDHEDVEAGIEPAMAAGAFANLFAYSTSLISAPDLTAKTLSQNCYAHMFDRCQNLVNAPKMSVTTLASGCCYSMFSDCVNLISLPQIPFSNLPASCYQYMFYGCEKIKISATQTSEYSTMYFSGYSGTANAVGQMFYGTGGTFTGTPDPYTTYFTANSIVQPGQVIQAGTYYGRSNIPSLDVGDIHVPFEATIDGVTESGFTALQFYTAVGDEYYFYGIGDHYLSAEIGSLDQIATNPDLWHLHLYSDDLSIRVLQDTRVSDTEYELFNKYFIPYQNVAFRGHYTFKHIDPSLYVNQTLPIPISFYVSGSAISGDEIRVTQFSANTYYYHAYANNVFVGTLCQVINGLAYPTVDGNTFRVTEDAPLTANELNMFDDLFIIYQQPTN